MCAVQQSTEEAGELMPVEPISPRAEYLKLHYRLLRIELKVMALAQEAGVEFEDLDRDLDKELAEELAKIN